jgi:hypothetical protein
MRFDESCISDKGNVIYGTAAVLHRLCGNGNGQPRDIEAQKEEYRRILMECNYTYSDEE